MKVGQPFNQLSKSQYFHYIDNHTKYTDFNTLGLYRSICENEKLELVDKLEVRDYANQVFAKTFNFLQLKDPGTYFDLLTLGRELTKADEDQILDDIKRNQEKILAEKKINHRNFGVYSKHLCGEENCHLNGLMIQKGSFFAESHLRFDSDKNRYDQIARSARRKKQRKNSSKDIDAALNES